MHHSESSIEYRGAEGDQVSARLFVPATPPEESGTPRQEEARRPRGGLVLAHDVLEIEAPDGGRTQALARALARAGYACLLPNLWSRGDGPAPEDLPLAGARTPWAVEARLPDRRALEDLDCAVRLLAARPDIPADGVGVLGLGSGGTLAFLLGCTSRDVALAIALGGRVLYPELSSRKPTQPLELLLNLDRPLLALCAAEDSDLPAAERELWAQKLDAGGKDFELVVYPGARPLGDDSARGEPFRRVLRFLEERL